MGISYIVCVLNQAVSGANSSPELTNCQSKLVPFLA